MNVLSDRIAPPDRVGAGAGRARVIAVNRFFWPDRTATSQLLGDLTRHLAAAGADVHVVTTRLPGDGAAPSDRGEGAAIHRVWAPHLGHSVVARTATYLAFMLTGSWRIYRLARAGDQLLVKTDPPLMSVPVALVARLRRARLVLWHQDVFPEVAEAVDVLAPRSLPVRLARWLRDRSLRRADHHVTISKAMAAKLRTRGVLPRRVSVIQNWGYSELEPVLQGDNPLRRAWGLGDRFVIGYSGNFGRAHLREQVAEFARRMQHVPGLVLLFVGGGSGRPQLEALQREIGPERMILQPHARREDLSQSLSVPDLHLVSLDPACEGLILPSKFYGILAVGRPVLNMGAPDGVLAHKVAHHRIGCTLGPDPESWRGLVEELMSDPARLADMGRRARRIHGRVYHARYRLAAWEALMLRRAPSSSPAQVRRHGPPIEASALT